MGRATPLLRAFGEPTDPALVFSSLLFLAPNALLAHRFPQSAACAGLAILSWVTAFVSVLTWWRRSNAFLADVDRIVARASGAVFTSVGLYVIPREDLFARGFPLWFAMLAMYGLSVWADRQLFHFAFHVAVSAGMCLIASHLVVLLEP
uniref:Uncharacterized protein n=1 Tax=Neobodo designis TaxID=312471 RepID=A0A7S1MEG4_NEODS